MSLVLRLEVLLLSLEVGAVDLLFDVGDGGLEGGLEALLLDLFSVMTVLKLLLLDKALLLLLLDQALLLLLLDQALLLLLLSKALQLLLAGNQACKSKIRGLLIKKSSGQSYERFTSLYLHTCK